MDPSPDPQCQDLAYPSLANFGISLFIVSGILISYLPQHVKIIARGTSKGLAPLFVLLGTVSGTAAFANILTRPETRTYFACCSPIGPFACFNAFLGVIQVFVQWFCFGLIMVLFLIFFPRDTEAELEEELGIPTWKEALVVLYISTVFFIAVFIVSILFEVRFAENLQGWADLLGSLSTTLAIIQYLPQIRTTWKMQSVGSLSIPMMCIQTPGSFVWAGSLFARLGPAGWSTWGMLLVTGCLQGCILAMGIGYTIRDWKAAKAKATYGAENGALSSQAEAEGDDADERTPLVQREANGQQQRV